MLISDVKVPELLLEFLGLDLGVCDFWDNYYLLYDTREGAISNYMLLRWRIYNWLAHKWEFKVRVPLWKIKRMIRRWRNPPVIGPSSPILQKLIKALETGSYSAGTNPGSPLVIEDLSNVMKCIKYDSPRPWPKWWEKWKLWNPRYMAKLREQRERSRVIFKK